MLEYIISFLQKIKDKQKLEESWEQSKEGAFKKWFFLIFWAFLVIWILAIQFDEFSTRHDLFSLYNLKYIVSFLISLLLGVGLYKTFINKESFWKYFYLIFFPLLLVIFFTVVDENHIEINLTVYLTIIYPILNILKFQKLDKIKKLFFIYNMWFYLFLAIYILLLTFWIEIRLFDWFGYVLTYILYEDEFFLLPLVFFCLTYWIYSLHTYFDESKDSKKDFKKGMGLFLVVSFVIFIGNLVPWFIDDFYRGQIKDAHKIINEWWENYKSYSDAKSEWFLERAFYNDIKQSWSLYDRDLILFNKIYDATPESYFGEKIAKYSNNRNSFETNLSKVWEKAEVVLWLAEINNNIFSNDDSNFPILETVYNFHLTNTINQNQEVIINFETPNKYSVISDLKLWLNSELQWQIAPRWAARKVYEDSLRRNTDPALIEKVGINTYSLKVFPIPRKDDSKTRWKQLVQVTILTPLLNVEEDLKYSPKFSFINLKFNEDSWIISKIYNNWVLEKEDIVKNDNIEEYLTSIHKINLNKFNLNSSDEVCADTELLSLAYNKNNKIDKNNARSNPYNEYYASSEYLIKKLKKDQEDYYSKIIIPQSQKDNLNKIAIFFDNSASIEKNNANKKYSDIFKNIKNYNWKIQDVDLYSFNSKIEKVLDVDNVKFWGNSNISSVIDYIENNNFINKRIIILTDDDNYDIWTFENKNINYSNFTNNQISVIKIWDKIKKYKSEFNNILAITNWNIYWINSNNDIKEIINNIFSNNSNSIKLKICSNENVKVNKILAWFISNKILSEISNNQDWSRIARKQTLLAEKYWIVNQFNSYIALETERQQRDLDRYSEEYDKYDTKYKNYWNSESLSNNRRLSNFDNEIFESWDSMNGIELVKSSSIDYWMNKVNYWAGDSVSSMSFSMNWRTNLSFYWIILILIYLAEFYSIISFIIKYRKSWKEKEDEKLNNNEELDVLK